MRYLLTFAPWIVFAVVPGAHWSWGAAAALVVAVGVLLQLRRAGTPADAMILEACTALFFVAVTVLAFVAPQSPLHPYSGAMSLAWLAVVAWTTLAVSRPFTLGIARQSVPEQLWTSPVFLHVNVVITRVWATAFTVTAAVIAAAVAAGAGTALTLPLQVMGFVVPMVFTVRYPKAVRARAQRAAAQGDAAQGDAAQSGAA